MANKKIEFLRGTGAELGHLKKYSQGVPGRPLEANFAGLFENGAPFLLGPAGGDLRI